MTTGSNVPRTYGNFKPAKRRLLGGLGPGGLVAGFVVLLAAFAALAVGSLPAAVAVLAVGVVVIGPVAVEVAGHSLAERAARMVLFARAARRKETSYRSGVVSRLPGTWRLPGVAWRSRVWDVETGRAGWPTVGVVIHPGPPRLFAATLRCHPPGTTLVDRSTVDTWIAQHAAVLEALAQEQDLVQAQITIDTAPDSGHDLARAVTAARAPTAPAVAERVMAEVVETYPRAGARVDTRVTVVYTAPRARKTRRGEARRVTDEEMVKRVAARLPAMVELLRHAGAGAVTPMSAADLAAVCRTAYDPACTADMDAAGPGAVTWSGCGPVAAHEHRDHYVHDSAVSVTWATAEAPRALLHDTVLTHLAAPDPTLLRKRVTLLLRPLSPAETARAVDADLRDSTFRAARKKKASARDLRDIETAAATAREEATGAGLVRWSVLYTATVSTVDDLDQAEARIRDLGATIRLLLRPLYYSQAFGFVAGLPVGAVPSVMARIRG
jgi:hypothetical protein